MALAATVAACSSGGVNPLDVIKPDVRLHHLGVKNIGLSGGTLNVALAFYNPNKVSLKGVGLSALIDVDGSRFGEVTRSEAFNLAGKDTTLLTLPLDFRWADVSSAARSIVRKGAVDYGISGKLTITAPAGASFEVPFTGQGNVPLLQP